MERQSRELLGGGRPELIEVDVLGLSARAFWGRPWARLAAAAILVARDPQEPEAERHLALAERCFRSRGDAEGLGYTRYVAGSLALGRGDFEDASQAWAVTVDLLGSTSPVGTFALAHLSLAAYHDGALDIAADTAERALALARVSVDRRAEGLALIYRSFADVARGDLQRVHTWLDAADAVFAELSDPLDRYEWSLVATLRLALHAHRGEREQAERAAAEAVDRARTVGVPWYEAIALATRSELCAAWDPERAMADGRAALDVLRALGDRWWETVALRGLSAASVHLGHHTTAVELAAAALEGSPGAFESARSRLQLGEALVAAGNLDGAVVELERARAAFARAGAALQHLRCLVDLAQADGRRREAWTQEALAIAAADPEPSRELMVAGLPAVGVALEISCVGPTVIRVGGQPVVFATRHAQMALLALALHRSPGGVHLEQLAEWLWPGAPADRVAGRIRTVLWQVRKALGSEAWRLRRSGASVVLDLEGARCDLLEELAEGRALLAQDRAAAVPADLGRIVARLDVPALVEHQYEEWAALVLGERTSLAQRLATVGGLTQRPVVTAQGD